MKVLLINGSPKANGNTAYSLSQMAEVFAEQGIETELIHVGNKAIRGCIAWMVFIDNNDAEGSIRVRLRSRFVHVNPVAEKYRGGGHACACGATVYSMEEMQALLRDADELVKDYKANNEDWL